MRFNAPKKMTWLVAFLFLLVGVISFILSLLKLPSLPCNLDTWCMMVSAILYALGTSLKGF